MSVFEPHGLEKRNLQEKEERVMLQSKKVPLDEGWPRWSGERKRKFNLPLWNIVSAQGRIQGRALREE